MSRGRYDQLENDLNVLDQDFIKTMLQIEKSYSQFSKHDKIRIQQWSKKLCIVTQNSVWKQTRNNYSLLLLNCIQNGALEQPFTKVPPEESLPALNTHIVRKRVSSQEKRILRQKSIDISSKSDLKEKESKPFKVGEIQINQNRMMSPTINKENNLNSMNCYTTPYPANREYNKNISVSMDYKNRQNFKEDVDLSSKKDNFERHSFSNPREIKFQTELDLAKVTIESLKSDVNIKNNTLSQLRKRISIMQDNITQLQSDKEVLVHLLKTIKQGLESHSIKFSNKAMEENFIKLFNENSLSFFVTHINSQNHTADNSSSSAKINKGYRNSSPLGRSIDSTLPTSTKNSLSTNPDRTELKENNPVTVKGKENQMSQRRVSAPLKENKWNNAPKDALLENSKPGENKNITKTSDKDLTDFLAYLEEFRNRNEVLKKETVDLLKTSSSRV